MSKEPKKTPPVESNKKALPRTNLSERVSKAMLGIGSLAADKRNKHDGYDYISSDKVLEEIGKTLGDLEVIVIPGVSDVEITKENRAEGKVMYYANVSMLMVVKSAEGELTVPWFGCGVDYRVPDKAVYKAITSGHSYFLRKLLMVGVGNEDGEHDVPESGGGGQSEDVEPALVKINFPKAKKMFGGIAPTAAQLLAQDPNYCEWIVNNKEGSAAEALKALIGINQAVERQSAETGIPTSHAGNVASINAVEVLLEQTDGKLTPSHYWPNVKAMGMGEERAKEICEGLDNDSDWRRVLDFACKEMKDVTESTE